MLRFQLASSTWYNLGHQSVTSSSSIPEQTIASARPDVTWPIDRHWNMIHSVRVDEELDLDLVEIIAERNAHPQWRERVQFLKNFRRQKWSLISRTTIDQIVQQEWIGAG